MRKQIEDQIDSAVEQLHALEIERAKLQARIETLRELFEMAPDDDVPKKSTRRRSLSPQWQGVLFLMQEEYAEGATYDEIHDLTKRVGIDMKKANLRGHMGNYKASGYVKAVSPGVFALTPDGKKQATKQIENPVPDLQLKSQDTHETAHRKSSAIVDAFSDPQPQNNISRDYDDEIPF